MKVRSLWSRFAVVLLSFQLLSGSLLISRAQDLKGAASFLVSQDLIGASSVSLKRPSRVRDLPGGSSLLIVRINRLTSPASTARQQRPTEQVARNNSRR